MTRAPFLALLPLSALALALLFAAAPSGQADDATDAREAADVLALIGPRPGEHVADLGCGNGRWTFLLAGAVGPEGKVYAVDIDPTALAAVRERRDAEGLEQVEIIQSVPDDPMLPVGSLDAVFLNNVIDYVDRSALVGFLTGVRDALRVGGRVIIRDPKGGADRVIAECYRAGFSLVEAKIPLPGAPETTFQSSWYALKLEKGEAYRHSLLPRLGRPMRYRTRLLVAEELYRAGVIERGELRSIWERVQNLEGAFDPERDEKLDLLTAAGALGLLSEDRIKALAAPLRDGD